MAFVMYMPDRQSRIMAQAKELFRRAKDLVLPELMVPALACAQAGAARTGNPGTRASHRSTDHLSLFDSGPAPKRGTPSRRIMDWEASISVLEANDARDPQKLQMTYEEAQRAMSEILKNPRAVHSYITSEAARMYNNDALVRKHALHLVLGALGEDYAFMPGESLKDISANPKDLQEALSRFKSESGAKSSGFFNGFMRLVSRIAGWFGKDPYDNPVNRPYWAHFYKLLNALDGEGLVLLGGELRFQSSTQRLMKYWKLATDYYAKGDLPRAFCALGHAVHLVQDMHVPAHVHNDPHGPTIFLGKEDSFEKWTARADFPDIARGPKDSNASIWDSRPFTPPAPESGWDKTNVGIKLTDFAVGIASNTQKYRSVDVAGIGPAPYQIKTGEVTGALSDAECKEQGKTLIPAAIIDSARLIVTFLDYVKRNGEPVAPAPSV